MTDGQQTPPEQNQGYQVLARKHRPQTFADLIGQEAMVRTLRNAFEHDRIHHAFVMTGVRGVGKTTTARIIAKGLNCIGEDGQGGATISPCGVCEPCRQIADSRHVDVLEMDAASRTGVGDIREIIDSVRYRAASARYKVYIIDEVHMLSTSAFNALLKTLEEPPAHVKFIFATTEIRKVPVTVLSRCQRFDLRRIEPEVMIDFLRGVAEQESAKVAEDALALITRAAEGSARDALSLLDQAIAHGAGETGADQVRAMLGLADRGRVIDLFEQIMKGDAAAALEEIGRQYADGADPLAVLRDLAELTHWISVVKINADNANDPTVSTDERDRGKTLAENLSMRAMTRMWQMLLKALEEVGRAPNSMMAAEMAIIRLTHVAELPTPGDIVKRLTEGGGGPRPVGPTGPSGPSGGSAPVGGEPTSGGATSAGPSGGVTAQIGGAPAPRPEPAPRASSAALAIYQSFDQIVALIRERRDMKLLTEVKSYLGLAHFSPGRIDFQPAPGAPPSLAQELGAKLGQWTGARWMVSVVQTGGQPTITAALQAERSAAEEDAKTNPLVAAVLDIFPGAKITELRDLAAIEEVPPPPPEYDDEDALDDDWSPVDPFTD
ncbi:MAG: DNA polymerase III subunit gamma/tau [Pikeienuella sp.]